MIEVRVDGMLGGRGRSFYWLAKEAGVSHTTPWGLKKGESVCINFTTLERICRMLSGQLGDVLRMTSEKKVIRSHLVRAGVQKEVWKPRSDE